MLRKIILFSILLIGLVSLNFKPPTVAEIWTTQVSTTGETVRVAVYFASVTDPTVVNVKVFNTTCAHYSVTSYSGGSWIVTSNGYKTLSLFRVDFNNASGVHESVGIGGSYVASKSPCD